MFYHCDQLIKGMYHVFLKRWRKEHKRLLLLRAEEYYATPKTVLIRVLRFLRLETPADWQPMLQLPVRLAGPRPVGGLPPSPRPWRASCATSTRRGSVSSLTCSRLNPTQPIGEYGRVKDEDLTTLR